jgi:hypothetical protein
MADPRRAARRTAALVRAGRALQDLGGALLELATEEDEAAPTAPDPTPPRESTRAMVGRVRPTDRDVAAARRVLRRKGVPLKGDSHE